MDIFLSPPTALYGHDPSAEVVFVLVLAIVRRIQE